MITTTLRQIRRHSPCRKGWNILLSSLGKTGVDDESLPLVTILQSNGLDDALWCLRTITGHDKEIIRFALSCAQEVKHLMTDQRSLDALDALERHLESPLSREELDKVLAAAGAAGAAARTAAARTAAWAAEWAAGAAAGAAAWAAEWAAEAAAGAAARAAARAAAGAAEAAARSAAAEAAAAEAAEAAEEAEEEAARAAARARQVQIFEGVFG